MDDFDSETEYDDGLDSFHDYDYGDFDDDEDDLDQHNHFYGRHNTYKSSKFNKVASVPVIPPAISYKHYSRNYKVTCRGLALSIVCLVVITALVLVTLLLLAATIFYVKLMGFLLVKTALILLKTAIFLLKISCKILFHVVLANPFRG
ncbi:hypothetical protein J4E80_000139 [Alternaria sp. BMP 0032]|nr:hypothetical protein J4E80_000139 [Alternaria sp. BMP 0032]